jgi:intracellular sulfur oxidation DsrE/DsrF family protein
MKHHDTPAVSNEQLNAYIDDELEFEERHSVFLRMGQDDRLNREAQELRQLRAMLQHAYRNPPAAPARRRTPIGHYGLRQGVAAMLLLSLGALVGWYGNSQLLPGDPLPGSVILSASGGSEVDAGNGLVLHLSSNDRAQMTATLDYAERLLVSQQVEGKPFRLAVVANSDGIELLRRDTSPYAARIARLLSDYDNIRFFACANALHNLQKQGVAVELLPGIRGDRSAIDAIIERLEGGWRYLKV